MVKSEIKKIEKNFSQLQAKLKEYDFNYFCDVETYLMEQLIKINEWLQNEIQEVEQNLK